MGVMANPTLMPMQIRAMNQQRGNSIGYLFRNCIKEADISLEYDRLRESVERCRRAKDENELIVNALEGWNIGLRISEKQKDNTGTLGGAEGDGEISRRE